MFAKVGEVLSALTRSDWVTIVASVAAVIVGIVTTQFSVTGGVILFAALIICPVIVTIYHLYDLRTYGGPYEVLDKESKWEFLDGVGRETIHYKRLKVRFIQNRVIAIADTAYGDGDLFAEYEVHPGKVVDIHQHGNVMNAIISLGETKNRGDIEEFKIIRKTIDGFKRDQEWIDIETENVCHRLQVILIIPTARRCKHATLTAHTIKTSKVVSRTKELDIEDPRYFRNLEDGRQQLSLTFLRPRTNVKYTIRWDW